VKKKGKGRREKHDREEDVEEGANMANSNEREILQKNRRDGEKTTKAYEIPELRYRQPSKKERKLESGGGEKGYE